MDTRYSESELKKFLDYVAEKGLVKVATARARKAAAVKVLSVLESTEKSDLRTLNRESIFQRFVNKHSQGFTPDSLQTYRSRFGVALDEFIAYTNNPAAYRPSASQRTRTAKNGTAQEANKQVKDTIKRESTNTTETTPVVQGLFAFPLPLPSGPVAQLYLPQKITSDDADRIAAVVKALAIGNEVRKN